MHQHLKDSIKFCYQQQDTTYEELFLETVEAEKEEVPETKVTSLKVKSAVTTEETSGIQDLQQKIDALTTVVKSSTLGGAQPKQPNSNEHTQQKNKDNGKGNQSLYKGLGPTTSALRPFKQGQKLYQCYNCGGWGHSYRQCPCPGGLKWRTLSGAKVPPSPRKGPNNEKKQ